MAWQFALGAGLIFCATTALRIYLMSSEKEWARKVHPWIPGGIAVAVGMYNTPSFTLARTAGGVIAWYWVTWKGRGENEGDCAGKWTNTGRGGGEYCEPGVG